MHLTDRHSIVLFGILYAKQYEKTIRDLLCGILVYSKVNMAVIRSLYP